MALILSIETATSVCSVSLASNGTPVAWREINTHNAHSKSLTLFIEAILAEAGKNINELDAIAVSKGPGSYTGLRIGVSTTKGIAYALGKPMISVNSLKSMALGASQSYKKRHDLPENLLFCPMIDARRMEVYAAVYDTENVEIRKTQADIVESDTYLEYLNTNHVVFFGDGAEKCKSQINHPNAIFDAEILPSALFMASIAEKKYNLNEFEDVAYFEPFYLKDFIATVPKKHIYG